MLWLTQFVSNIGTFMQGNGAVWVMLELHQSPVVVALVRTAVSLPVLLPGVASGGRWPIWSTGAGCCWPRTA
jgi:hypothetical protein